MLIEANGTVSFKVRVDALGLRYLSLGLTSFSLKDMLVGLGLTSAASIDTGDLFTLRDAKALYIPAYPLNNSMGAEPSTPVTRCLHVHGMLVSSDKGGGRLGLLVSLYGASTFATCPPCHCHTTTPANLQTPNSVQGPAQQYELPCWPVPVHQDRCAAAGPGRVPGGRGHRVGQRIVCTERGVPGWLLWVPKARVVQDRDTARRGAVRAPQLRSVSQATCHDVASANMACCHLLSSERSSKAALHLCRSSTSPA